MRAPLTKVAPRGPQPARGPAPGDVPRHRELAAAAALAVAAQLLLAPLILLLAAGLLLATRLARWRAGWLALPAAAGLLWALALGPRAALAGVTGGPREVLGYLAGHPGWPARPGATLAALARGLPWLARQAPLALLVAPAESAAALVVRSRRTGRPARPGRHPGLLAAARRQCTVAAVEAGGVAGRAGTILGADLATGRPVQVPWQAAAGGVLVTGPDPARVAAASFQFVHAAVRRRQPVIVADLAATPGLAGALAAVCADSAAPLHVFGAAGPGCYDPLRGGPPRWAAALLAGLIGWPPGQEPARQAATRYLSALFAVTAAAPAGRPGPVLDEVAALLSPAALCARMGQVPPGHPGRRALDGQVRDQAGRLAADSALAAFLAAGVSRLRAGPLARWLRPAGPGEQGITLAGVARDRAVVLFALDAARNGPAAGMIARLAAADLAATWPARPVPPGDGLAWFGAGPVSGGPALAGPALPGPALPGPALPGPALPGPALPGPALPGPALPGPELAALIAAGQRAGLATVVSAGPGPAASRAAGLVNVHVAMGAGPGGPFSLRSRRPAGTVAAARFAAPRRPAPGWGDAP